jgi:hexokinase
MIFRKFLIFFILTAFLFQPVVPVSSAMGQELSLPSPGAMVLLSDVTVPVMLKGIRVHPQDPLLMDFILDTGHSGIKVDSVRFRAESEKAVKYFLTSLAIPGKDLWVNLSPYEKDRMMPQDLSQTLMGRNMLAQDYVLKQLTASLTWPESALGRKFWDRVYALARERFGDAGADISPDTFNKVWITPDRARVLETDDAAYVVDAHLKVMIERDYLAQSASMSKGPLPTRGHDALNHLLPAQELASQVLKDIIVPEIEKEVNEGAHFAPLRQMFYAMVLAAWYKTSLKEALLNQVYANRAKTNGVGFADPAEIEKIYANYLESAGKGVFNYIREVPGSEGGELVPRKYLSGGEDFAMLARQIERTRDPAEGAGLFQGATARVEVRFRDYEGPGTDPAMVVNPDDLTFRKQPQGGENGPKRFFLKTRARPETEWLLMVYYDHQSRSTRATLQKSGDFDHKYEATVEGKHDRWWTYWKEAIKAINDQQPLPVKSDTLRPGRIIQVDGDRWFRVIQMERRQGPVLIEWQDGEKPREKKPYAWVEEKWQQFLSAMDRAMSSDQPGRKFRIFRVPAKPRFSAMPADDLVLALRQDGEWHGRAAILGGFSLFQRYPLTVVDRRGGRTFVLKTKDLRLGTPVSAVVEAATVWVSSPLDLGRALEQNGPVLGPDTTASFFQMADQVLVFLSDPVITGSRDLGQGVHFNDPAMDSEAIRGPPRGETAGLDPAMARPKTITPWDQKQARIFREGLERQMRDWLSRPVAERRHMLPTYLKANKGMESGISVGIDFSGTNLRVILVDVNRGATRVINSSSIAWDADIKTKGSAEIFDLVADKVIDVLEEVPAGRIQFPDELPVGLGFGFGTLFLGPEDARLVQTRSGWGFADLLEGEKVSDRANIFEKVQAAFDGRLSQRLGVKLPRLRLKRLLNDTTAVAVDTPYSRVGVVIGTGFNISFLDQDGYYINGQFGSLEPPEGVWTEIDQRVWDSLEPSERNIKTGKMATGPFVGELIRLQLQDMHDAGDILGGLPVPVLGQKQAISPALITEVRKIKNAQGVIPAAQKVAQVLGLNGGDIKSDQEAEEIVRVFDHFMARSAQVVAQAIAVTLRWGDPKGKYLAELGSYTVSIDGGTLKNIPGYEELLLDYLVEYGEGAWSRGNFFIRGPKSFALATARGAALSVLSPDPDSAMAAIFTPVSTARDLGGIALNAENLQMDIYRNGRGMDMGMTPEVAERFWKDDFSGIVPVIVDVTPLQDPLSSLGLVSAAAKP